MQTSVTTGESKIIQTNIKKLFESSINFNKFYKLNIKKYNFWNFYSLNYMGGFYNLTLIPFFSGNSVVISRDNDNEFYFNFLNNIKKFKIDVLWLTPVILNFLTNKDNIKNFKIFNYIYNIKFAFVGMGKSDFFLKKNFYKFFKIPIYDIYGLSEVPLFIGENEKNYKKIIRDSIGNLLPMNKIKFNTIGIKNQFELMVKSKFMFDGYLEKNKKINKPFDKEGFFQRNIVSKYNKFVLIKEDIKK